MMRALVGVNPASIQLETSQNVNVILKIMRRLILPALAGLIILGFGAFVVLHSSSIALLSPAGPIAAAERSVFLWTLLLAATVVLPVFLMLFVFAWRYRAHTPEAKM